MTATKNKLKQPISASVAEITSTSNQIVLGGGADGSGYKATINAQPTANRTLNTPDASGTFATQEYVTSALTSYPNLSTANIWTAAQSSPFVTLTDASTIAWDMSLGNNLQVQLGGSRTLGIPTNIRAGYSGILNVYQDPTGSRTLAYGAGSSGTNGNWPYQFQGGSAFVLSTSAASFDQISYTVNYYATSTVTVSIATPGVVSWTAHGLLTGWRIRFTTTGALPTGLSANTTYWVTKIDADTFKLSTTLANLRAGTYIATSGSQSGTHTCTACGITLNLNPNNQ